MKRFDKGYIYSGLLTDLFYSIFLVFAFLNDILVGEEADSGNLGAAITVFALASAAVYIGFIVYRILYYRASGYELTESEIRCKRGVLFRKRSFLDYNKVHAINKKQNIIQKIFGIAVLTVDSGSANTSHQAEITIVEKEKTVDALIRELNSLKENGTRSCDSDQKDGEVLLSDKDSLYRFTSKKKMLYTLINIVSIAFVTALCGVLVIVVLAACKLTLQGDFLGTWGQYFLFAALITLGAMLLFSMFSFIVLLIQSFVGYYKFSITKQDGNIQISFGLLEKHTNVFSYDKIKAVKISQGLVQRILGFATVKLEVIGYMDESGNNGADVGVLVPFCKYGEVEEILGKVLPDYTPIEKQTSSVSFFPFVSWFALIFGIIAGIVLIATLSILAVLDVPSYVILSVALAFLGVCTFIIALKALSALLSYQNNGIGISGEKITVYSGGIIRTVTVFMAKHLISVESVTTPLREKHGIASVVMHLKTNEHSNEVKVHIQKGTLSDELEKMQVL